MIPFRAPAYQHGDVIEMAGGALRLRVNPRAGRVSLRLDRTSGEVIATAPSARKLAEAVAFARERAGWIAARVAELPERTALEPGLIFDLFGDPVVLEAGAGRAKLIKGPPHRLISADDAAFGVRALRIVKGEALKVLTERTAHYAEELGQAMPSVAIGDPRGRWGSCKPAVRGEAASIRYSWRLALAPFEIADYVVAHEAAHLVEANHGPRFWAVVKRLYGDHKHARDWLKRESSRLHAFGR
ncbi:MAG TPA: SprT family zinc-dependent metalloprotease [Caulobacteraceae bacterium]|nr:SprT family zinc-dependent metalloprotease [Caulobacteraceae bacterium]